MKNILSNWAWLSSSRALSFIFSIIVSVYIAKHLGPKVFGEFSLAQSILGIYSVFSILKLDELVIKGINQMPSDSNAILSSAIILRLIGSAFTILLILITVPLLYSGNTKIYIYSLMLAFVPMIQITNIFSYYFIALGRSKNFATPCIISSIIFFPIKFFVIFFFKDIVILILIIILESIFLSLLIYRKFISFKIDFVFSFNCTNFLVLLKKSLPLTLAFLGVLICSKLDILMISKILDSENIGFYAAATKISESTSFIFSTLLIVVFSSITSKNKTQYGKYLPIIIYSTIIVSTMIYLLSNYIVLNIFGYVYLDSIQPLKILSWSIIFFTLYSFLSQLLILNNEIKIIFFSSCLMILANIFLNIYLIPKFQLVGAAISTLTSLILGCIFLYSIIKKKYKQNFKDIVNPLKYFKLIK